jgi:hypothetical protein
VPFGKRVMLHPRDYGKLPAGVPQDSHMGSGPQMSWVSPA